MTTGTTYNKHLKGYMFDSLVFRFKEYQAKAFEGDLYMVKSRKNVNDMEAHKIVSDRHDRDLMRFIQILDEAVGEHD